MVKEKTDIPDHLIGANASAEGGTDDAVDSSEKSGCNITIANRLQRDLSFDKAQYQKHIKV